MGLAYSLWHDNVRWTDAEMRGHRPWGRPELGYYRSDDPAVLSKHAEWLTRASVDFVYLDWSNNIEVDVRRGEGPPLYRFIEQASLRLFDTWHALPQRPQIGLMIGIPGDPSAISNGKLTAKADEVYDLFVQDRLRRQLLQTHLGKPLLLVYVNTPSPWQNGLPPWSDERFTVRFMTGFLTEQRALLKPDGISRYGYWSWEDRGKPTYSVVNGHPECMTVVAAWRSANGQHRAGGRDANNPGRAAGQTYTRSWEYARKIGPRFVLAGTFNEWWSGEQIDLEDSKDIEPSKELGSQYMDLLRQQAELFKQGL